VVFLRSALYVVDSIIIIIIVIVINIIIGVKYQSYIVCVCDTSLTNQFCRVFTMQLAAEAGH